MEWDTAGLKITEFKISIGHKLLFISAVLLVVPWLGVKYIQDMESFLKANLQEDLLGRARIVAAVLQSHPQVFAVALKDDETLEVPAPYEGHMYVRPLRSAIQLDAYDDDWEHYQDRVEIKSSTNPDSLSYQVLIGTRGKYLYMLFKVRDDKVVYRGGRQAGLEKNDHLKLSLTDKQGQLKKYMIATIAPGWVNAYEVEDFSEATAAKPIYRIKGEWQETSQGYNIELRLPLSQLGDKLAYAIADVDDATNRIVSSNIGSVSDINKPGSLVIPSPEVEALLQQIIQPGARTWVLDSRFRVLAVADSLRKPVDNPYENTSQDYINQGTRIIYRWLLNQPSSSFKDTHSAASYFHGETIRNALQGKASTTWRRTPDEKVSILTASYPVVVDGETIGAVAIEETSNSILLLQNRAMEILINLSIISFALTVVVLLGFASLLSARIVRLRNDAEKAINENGKIVDQVRVSRSGDEIGDLTRSFADMLQRLSEYNRYLETMASKLSHEIRTPITVVKSSLENLQLAKDEQREVYVERAREGIDRLDDILRRMSEASRLEQTLQSETREQVNLSVLVEHCVDGYRLVNNEVDFRFSANTEQCLVVVAPELIAQMLDKIISNAIDFHAPNTAIEINLHCDQQQALLSVSNKGPLLPEAMKDNLFESMVSLREKRTDNPNLGLGLYVVRLIAEFHKGHVTISNLDTQDGVRIEAVLPLI